MHDSSVNDRTGKPQFSLRWLLLVTTGAGVYLGVVVAASGNNWQLMDVLMDSDVAVIAAIVCFVVWLTGLVLMVLSIALSRTGYAWPTGLLLSAIAYAAANVIVFIATILVDRFAIFEPIYMIAAAFVAPAVMFVALAIVTGFIKRLGWLGPLGFVLFVACVAFAQLWIIAAASASV